MRILQHMGDFLQNLLTSPLPIPTEWQMIAGACIGVALGAAIMFPLYALADWLRSLPPRRP